MQAQPIIKVQQITCANCTVVHTFSTNESTLPRHSKNDTYHAIKDFDDSTYGSMYLISSLSKHLTKSPEASLGAIPKQTPHQRVGHSSFRALGVGPYMRLSFVELECSAKAVVSSHATNVSVDASEALSNRAIAKEGQPFHLELDKQQCPWVKENIKPMRKINANSRGKNIIKIQC